MGQLQYKPLYPWLGGLNTSQDPIILDPMNLIVADNIVFTTQGSRRKRGGQVHYNTAAASFATGSNFVYMTNYWANTASVKKEYFVAVSDNGKVGRSNPNGTATWASFSTLTLSVTHGGVTSAVMNEKLILGIKGSGLPKTWDQSTSTHLVNLTSATTAALPFTNAWICKSFIERMFYAGDPALPDRIYVSKVGTYNNFDFTLSAGFATTLDIGVGDGDPSGITAIFPGTGADRVLYVAKRRHLYRISCADANQANWSITLVSDQIGVINPNVVATIDEADVIFMSDRGVHTLNQVISATAIVDGEFLSFPIQPDYLSIISAANRGQISATWVPSINSYLFSCKRVGTSTYECIYGFNVELKQWFRWTSVPCNYIFTRFNSTLGIEEIYACAPNGFINKIHQTSTLNDFGSAITATITSTFIYPDGIPFMEYNFTRLALIYRSHENSNFRVQYAIDGVITGSFTMLQKIAGGNVLGTTLLGPAFLLGSIQAVKPNFQHINGVGNSIQITVIQNGLNQDLDLFGLIIEYENAGDRQNPFNASAFN